MALNGDAPFALEVHVVECLVLHLPLTDGSCGLQKTICEGAFAMVDVGNDAKITDVFHQWFVYCKITPQALRLVGCSVAYFMRR